MEKNTTATVKPGGLMSSQSNGLPQGWSVRRAEPEQITAVNEQEDNPDLPKGWSVRKAEPQDIQEEQQIEAEQGIDVNEAQGRDVVSEQQQAAGMEPDFGEELERAAERGTAEATRGLLSGFSFGQSEKVPGLKTGENIASGTGKAVGSFIPITGALKIFHAPLVKAAAGSPVLKRTLGVVADLTGAAVTGAAVNLAEQKARKDEMPSVTEMLEHGGTWLALDAALQLAGAGGRFTKALLTSAKSQKQTVGSMLNRVATGIESSGERRPDRVEKLAFDLLGQETEAASKAIKPSKKTPGELQKEQTAKAAEESFAKREATNPKDITTKKITEENSPLLKQEIQLAEPYKPYEVNFSKQAEALEKSAIEAEIETVGTKAATEEELGINIKNDIEAQRKTARAENKPYYETAQIAAAETGYTPAKTAKVAGDELLELIKFKTKPEGYQATIKHLTNVIEDSGYKIIRNEAGQITEILSEGPVLVSDIMELGRRLNEIADYEAIEPSVKDAIKKVVKAVKQDVRDGLAQNPEAFKAFERAEKKHAETAEKFGRDSIEKIRTTEAGERVASMTKSPTTLKDLKQVLSPEQMLQVERDMLERLNRESFDKAKKMFDQNQSFMTEHNRKIAQNIIESKNPHNPRFRVKQAKQGILEDMSKSFNTGERPEKTLNLWKTAKGQKLVKEAIHGSPNARVIEEYLSKQTFNDMASTVIKDGKLDLAEYKKFTKDPNFMASVYEVGGKDAVHFFEGLESQVKQYQKNIQFLDRIPTEMEAKKGMDILKRAKEKQVPTKETKIAKEAFETQQAIKEETTGIKGKNLLQRMADKDFKHQARINKWGDWFKDTLGFSAKAGMSFFSIAKFGWLVGIPSSVATVIGFRLMNKMLTSPRVRRAVSEAFKTRNDPINALIAWDRVGELLDETEEEPEQF